MAKVPVMAEGFLDILERHGEAGARGSGGPAAEGRRHRHTADDRREFAFATGIECSNPTIVDAEGHRLRRDMLEECGHYDRWQEDLKRDDPGGVHVDHDHGSGRLTRSWATTTTATTRNSCCRMGRSPSERTRWAGTS